MLASPWSCSYTGGIEMAVSIFPITSIPQNTSHYRSAGTEPFNEDHRRKRKGRNDQQKLRDRSLGNLSCQIVKEIETDPRSYGRVFLLTALSTSLALHARWMPVFKADMVQ